MAKILKLKLWTKTDLGRTVQRSGIVGADLLRILISVRGSQLNFGEGLLTGYRVAVVAVSCLEKRKVLIILSIYYKSYNQAPV